MGHPVQTFFLLLSGRWSLMGVIVYFHRKESGECAQRKHACKLVDLVMWRQVSLSSLNYRYSPQEPHGWSRERSGGDVPRWRKRVMAGSRNKNTPPNWSDTIKMSILWPSDCISGKCIPNIRTQRKLYLSGADSFSNREIVWYVMVTCPWTISHLFNRWTFSEAKWLTAKILGFRWTLRTFCYMKCETNTI